ncbi:hypothetical protein KY290_031061 [Solanum tuberosum]|uniref:Uncharacterized protein n=1 Tax=Solanum tuberosum TaxID=4113 RepID=A0ABQ7U8E1_SOLTU|nr:hypothetical protein KY290_031061 [Solanum tuberosum]
MKGSFYPEILDTPDGTIDTRVQEVEIHLSQDTLSNILDVPCKGIRSIERCAPLDEYIQKVDKFEGLKCSRVLKKYLKGDHQLYFEFVNKVLLPCTKKIIVASLADLFSYGNLDKYDAINPPGYLLNKVFYHFNVPLGKGVAGNITKAFSMNTLIECECREGKVKSNSRVLELLKKQEVLKREMMSSPAS